MKPAIALLFVLFASLYAQAQTVSLGTPTISGSGCPIGSVSAVLAPDGSAISILFSEFNVTVPAGAKLAKSATCSFHIPITVTKGFIVEGNYVDYRGFANIPAGSYGRLTTSSPVWRRMNRFMEQYQSGSGAQSVDARHYAVQQQWGNPRFCPQPPIQFSTKLDVSASGAAEDTILTLDSADIAGTIDGPITVGITIRKCN